MAIPEWGLTSKGSFEPIISRELFQRVQMKLSGKSAVSTPRRKLHPAFPLRVFVRCAHCATPITGSFAKGRFGYYFCRNKLCKKLSVQKEQIERDFIALLVRCEMKPQYLRVFQAIITDVWGKRGEQVKQSYTAASKKVEDLKQRKHLMVNALIERRIAQGDYDDVNDSVNEELALAEMAREDAKLDDLEIEAVLAFAQIVMGNVARL